MPSRKRSKGKERKAKAALAPTKVSRWEMTAKWGENNIAIQCSHTSETNLVIPEISHPVYAFLHAVYSFDGPTSPQWYEIMKMLYTQHPLVFERDDHNKLARSILLAFSVNTILREDTYATPNIVSSVLLLLENFDDSKDFESSYWSAAPKIRDITYSLRTPRVALKFYSKRIGCSCLKEKYAQSRGLNKTGECHNCCKHLERRKLMVCSRCKVNHYCSDECHREKWPIHKKWCDKVVNSKKDA